MTKSDTENRNVPQAPITALGIADIATVVQAKLVLTTAELLGKLTDRGVKNADIARALGIAPSRVTEIWKGERSIKLDEAAKLVAQFDLESLPSRRVSPLPAPVSRLIVRYISEELKCQVPEARILDIAEDVRAFAEFVTDPTARDSIEMAATFFQALRLRRTTVETEAPQ